MLHFYVTETTGGSGGGGRITQIGDVGVHSISTTSSNTAL